MVKRLIIAGFIFGSTFYVFGQVPATGNSIRETITDSELTVPEDMERNFDQLLSDWKKDYAPSHSCPYDGSAEKSFQDSDYINKLYSLPTQMELVYNPIVRSYIDMYTGRRRSSVEYFLGKSHYYFPIFEQALDKEGLPLELKYLPIIESALNPTIVSRAGATGLWQFMIGTGKMYDLEINSLVDERRDPLKSTTAAVRYLKDLHNIYGDWNLVIAAYNCGPGNVNKAIKKSGGKTDYWEIYPYLPRETRGYVPAFIAATYVMNYHSDHNICPFEYNYTHSIDTIFVDRYLHLQQLADVLNLPVDEIRSLNPQFKQDIVPGQFKTYTVTLPSTQATDFEVLKESVYSYKPEEFLVHRKVVEPSGSNSSVTKVRHKVRRGETLASIASRHGVTTKQLRGWNRLKSNKLRTGQLLVVNKTVIKPKSTESTEAPQYYSENQPTVMAASVSTSAADNTALLDGNSQTPSMLAEYFSKFAPSSRSVQADPAQSATEDPGYDNHEAVDLERATGSTSSTIYHKVRIGETISQIAAKYNVEKDDVSTWNKLKSSIPKIGQRLVIHLPAQTRVETTVSESSDFDISNNGGILMAENVIYGGPDVVNVHRSEPVSTDVALSAIEPEPQKKVKKKEPAKNVKNKKKQSVYTVRRGDTLSQIAGKFGGSVTAGGIMKENKLRSDKLKIGQKLKIPR